MQAYGRLLGVLQELGPFPAGLVLHSWSGPPEMVAQLAAIEGVHFSVSGHATRLKLAKARATVAAVRTTHEVSKADSRFCSLRFSGRVTLCSKERLTRIG